MKYSCGTSYKKKANGFPDFEIQEIQELNENSENQNHKKSASTRLNVWTSLRANATTLKLICSPKTYEAKRLKDNRQLALHD